MCRSRGLQGLRWTNNTSGDQGNAMQEPEAKRLKPSVRESILKAAREGEPAASNLQSDLIQPPRAAPEQPLISLHLTQRPDQAQTSAEQGTEQGAKEAHQPFKEPGSLQQSAAEGQPAPEQPVYIHPDLLAHAVKLGPQILARVPKVQQQLVPHEPACKVRPRVCCSSSAGTIDACIALFRCREGKGSWSWLGWQANTSPCSCTCKLCQQLRFHRQLSFWLQPIQLHLRKSKRCHGGPAALRY